MIWLEHEEHKTSQPPSLIAPLPHHFGQHVDDFTAAVIYFTFIIIKPFFHSLITGSIVIIIKHWSTGFVGNNTNGIRSVRDTEHWTVKNTIWTINLMRKTAQTIVYHCSSVATCKWINTQSWWSWRSKLSKAVEQWLMHPPIILHLWSQRPL